MINHIGKYINRIAFTVAGMLTLALTAGCDSIDDGVEPGTRSEGVMVLRVGFAGEVDSPSASVTRAPGDSWFDNFDNEADKWGVTGENMESLRVIVIDGAGVVEHNNLYELSNATQAGEYKYPVKAADTKTILLFANEGQFSMDTPGMEIAGGVESLPLYFESLKPGSRADVEKLRKATLSLKYNSPAENGSTLRTPLPISAVYTEQIPAGAQTVEKEYVMHRAAVKYSVRIINRSQFPHTLEKLRLDRVADREFLFPDADWETNALGHMVIKDYRTPDHTQERVYENTLTEPLVLPAGMEKGVEAITSFYVPEGFKGDQPQRMSITLDGTDLDIWRDLKWIMPGESEAQARPMCDLPRNTHVVVNITISDTNRIDMVADVQPYSGVVLKPWFGLDRDEFGHIIVKRYEDGTYDTLDDDGKTVKRDQDGDEILRFFEDGTLHCITRVYKDYIHDESEVDYEYEFEKDAPGGNMIIIRQKTKGGEAHDDWMASHEHGMDDRPVFVLDKKGDFHRVIYKDDGSRELSRVDIHGDSIVQVNGFQFRDMENMKGLMGTYIVRLANGTDQLRDYYDNCNNIPWPAAGTVSEIIAKMRRR